MGNNVKHRTGVDMLNMVFSELYDEEVNLDAS